jgi:hypothetical protein
MSETMTLERTRDTLLEWLKEIAVRHGSLKEHVREDSRPSTPGHLRYILCTDSHTYYIHATPTYLGCGANSRKTRAGEDWHRGNDLPDGPFNHETWEAIKDAIISYELVKLEPVYEPVGTEGEGVMPPPPGPCPTCVGGPSLPGLSDPTPEDEGESAFDEGAVAGVPV